MVNANSKIKCTVFSPSCCLDFRILMLHVDWAFHTKVGVLLSVHPRGSSVTWLWEMDYLVLRNVYWFQKIDVGIFHFPEIHI